VADLADSMEQEHHRKLAEKTPNSKVYQPKRKKTSSNASEEAAKHR
jgi:hypothetical protein